MAVLLHHLGRLGTVLGRLGTVPAFVCGFSSPINRERTEHIIDMLGATKIAKGETK
jgi:hypothetical protein